jgi:hypothetical protein
MATQTKAEDTSVDIETLQKGLDDSIASLRGILESSGSVAPLSKAKRPMSKADDEDYDDDDEDMDEEDDTEDDEMEKGGSKTMRKSLASIVADGDEEAEIAMDVEPFLKSLVNGMQEYIDLKFSRLQKSLGRVQNLTKAQAEVTMAAMELQKSMSETVEQFGRSPVPSASMLRKGGSRFAGEGAKQQMDGRAILRKSFDLVKSGKITTVQASKIEGRVNKGLPLPDDVAHLFEGQEA